MVITGAGDRAFSAGGDLEMARETLTTIPAARTHSFQRMVRVSALMTAIGAPVLCAVNGACVGGGAELVCFADLVIAADTATFCYNGTKGRRLQLVGRAAAAPADGRATPGRRDPVPERHSHRGAGAGVRPSEPRRPGRPAARGHRRAGRSAARPVRGGNAADQGRATPRARAHAAEHELSGGAERLGCRRPGYPAGLPGLPGQGTIDWRSTRPGLQRREPE